MNELSELTLEELGASLRKEASTASGSDSGAWDKLIQIADDLNSGNRVDLLTRNRKWLLRNVSVSGFRGARHEVNLEIDNLQGVTVLFGENGSGKSTLAEAVRVALEGRTGATHLGSTGTVHELWGAVDQRSKGAEEATVKVVLFDEPTADIFTISATITENGVERTGLLQSGDAGIDLDDDSPAWLAWADAIRASPPVLAYAELADELQKKRDLQLWLTSCLAMDNASRVFDSRVKEQVDAASSAQRSIEVAKEASSRAVDKADEEAREQGVEEVAPLEWKNPSSREDLNKWLELNQLVERQRSDNHLDSTFITTLVSHVESFRAASANWSRAATRAFLTAQVTDSILELNSRVMSSGQGDNEETCPTCGTPHTDWRGHLRVEATRLEQARKSATELRTLIRRSRVDLVSPLRTCLLALSPEYDIAETSHLKTLVEAAEAALQGTDDLAVELLDATENLAKWSDRPEARSLMRAALAASGLNHQWRCNRWEAVSPYLSAFEEHIDLASKAATLKKARGKWNSHLARIRAQRSSSLHALVGPAVESLLGDVGISVSAIDITKQESRLDLKNAKGESVELAHLSAGQRNALILGPVIATAESGIFAFSILDDPVHAFDDFRVDRLSSTLAKIGKNQSLVLATHDARFVEYLRVHASLAFVVLATSRDDDGIMALTPMLDPPAELINFGRQLARDLKSTQASEGRAEITALLRMALDEALEHVALRYFSRLSTSEVEGARDTFSSAMRTKDRKKVLKTFLADSPTQVVLLNEAWNQVAQRAKDWSNATHDPSAVPATTQLEADIEIAQATVDLLRGI